MYISVKGNGPPMVLIHGWGIAGNIWNEIAKSLSKKIRVTYFRSSWNGKEWLDRAIQYR